MTSQIVKLIPLTTAQVPHIARVPVRSRSRDGGRAGDAVLFGCDAGTGSW
ncbi:hypothetical protein [Actinomadura madurae]|nr:hypothetical protein [Actinomadura madurae]MCQ0018491.1 hypothetical protein [Actinomadura madurae]